MIVRAVHGPDRPEDVPCGGKQIRRGDLVLPVLAAANRDPSHFPDPDRLDVRDT